VPIYKCRVCGVYTTESYHCGKPCIYLMNDKQKEQLSHLISAILRHIPYEACVELDDEGFVEISKLVHGIKNCWRNKHLYQWVTEDHIKAIAYLDKRGRFEIRNNIIRATYGHSVKVNIKYPIDNEVKILYHGTIRENLQSILQKGLIPGKRLYVHLTIDKEIAKEVGQRHGKNIVILKINADCVRKHGYEIYKANQLIYLTKYVPPQCIEIEE